MPRSIALNDQAAPRRRKAAAAKERGLIMQLIFHSPKDALASTVAVAAVLAIIVNALFLQAGRHPSPLFGSIMPLQRSAPEVQPKPSPTAALPAQAAAAPQAVSSPISSPMPRPRPAEAEPRPGDALGNLVRSTSAPAAPSAPAAAGPRPPAAIPQPAAPAKADGSTGSTASSARVAAVQRALTDYGYGQLKATGTVGADTQAAIQKFERERKLPLTGQVSERLVRELGLATGRSFE